MRPLNMQPPEKLVPEGAMIQLAEHPWLTVQGEGPFAGCPAVFVRLAGCNLKCPGCDTDYTTHRCDWPMDELVEHVARMADSLGQPSWAKTKLLVVTGGEPFRQPHQLTELVRRVTDLPMRVQIETNGVEKFPAPLSVNWNPLLTIVASPKISVHTHNWKAISCVKYVLRDGKISPEDGLPTEVLGYTYPPDRPPPNWAGTVYVQPEDEGDEERNRMNARATVNSAMRFGYTVSLQLHKTLGMP